jgi:hypothetical protein
LLCCCRYDNAGLIRWHNWRTGSPAGLAASEWKLTGFHQLERDPAQIKQVHDVVPIDDGTFLSGMKTSLNGLQFGLGIPKEQIKAVGGLHGPAHMLNYDDHIWT